jgi:molybdopterin molybdotransferase
VAAALLTIAEARELVTAAATPLGAETVPIADARDRVLAETVQAAGDVPPFPCSAMDGYAIAPGDADRTLAVVGESRAGAPSAQSLGEGATIRISTGAAVPEGATAVIPQENVEVLDGSIVTRVAVAAGDNVRDRGEDMRAGVTVLAPGCLLGAAELGAAVAAGAAELVVARRPRVQVLSTGDELRAPGE